MINHPAAQAQRWVTIHHLDTDGDREWEALTDDDRPVEAVDDQVEEAAPF